MLKLLHTSDWHLGIGFGQFPEEQEAKLKRARLDVVDKILGLAEEYSVDAVICAGDLFDEPEPSRETWEGLLKALQRRTSWTRPVILLPGVHDPLLPASVYAPGHPFRRGLPSWVHVVDREDFTLALGANAVLCAVPCTSASGSSDPTERLPMRAPDDRRLRIGVAHGATRDAAEPGLPFPIALDAAQRRGFDYLAVGGRHSFQEIRPGTVYSGTPEPTSFAEGKTGNVVLVYLRGPGERPKVQEERVGRWTWRLCECTSMQKLRALRSDDLTNVVLGLTLRLSVTLPEHEEIEGLLVELAGSTTATARAGVLLLDRSTLQLVVSAEAFPDELPSVVATVVRTLKDRQVGSDTPVAQRAMLHLYRMLKED